MREAYSHEVSSAGFWPGGGGVDYPAFYSYAYPVTAAFTSARGVPAQAQFNKSLGEFLLPYEVVRGAEDPTGNAARFPGEHLPGGGAGDGLGSGTGCATGVPGVPRQV